MKQHTHRRQCPSWNLFLLMIVLACSPHSGRQQINPAFLVDPQTGDVTLEEGSYIITTPEGYPVECKRESEYNCEQNAAADGDAADALAVDHQKYQDDDKLAETVTYHKSDKGVVLQCKGYAVTDCSPADAESPEPGTKGHDGLVMASPEEAGPEAVKNAGEKQPQKGATNGTAQTPSPSKDSDPGPEQGSGNGSGNGSPAASGPLAGDSPDLADSDSDHDKGQSGIPLPSLPSGKDVEKKLRDFGNKVESALGEINGQNKKKRKKAREIRRMVAELADLDRQVTELADQVMSELNEVNQSLGALDRQEDFHSRDEIDSRINQAGREHNKISEDIINSLPNPDDYDSDQVAEEEKKNPQPGTSSKHRDLNTANTYKDYVQERVEEMPEGVAKDNARKLVAGAKDALEKAEDYYDSGDQGAGDFAKELGIALLDIALGFVPFVGVTKDVFELYTGKNALTGEELSPFELTMAGIGVASAGVLSGVKNVPKGLKVLKEVLEHSDETADSAKAADEGLELWTALQKSDAPVDQILDALKEPIQAMGAAKFTEVLRTPKGSRPRAETYLPKDYVDNHIAKFDDGASRFMSKSQLDTHGPAQIDGTSFVVPRHEADKLLQEAGGNKRVLEESLGLPRGFLDSNELVRVDIADPRALNSRIPSGNEAGASELWLPGGKLPNGNSEVVIDLANAPSGSWTIKEASY